MQPRWRNLLNPNISEANTLISPDYPLEITDCYPRDKKPGGKQGLCSYGGIARRLSIEPSLIVSKRANH